MSEPERPQERPQTKPFAAFLQELNRGSTHDELSARLADLTAAVLEHGKKGSISLTIDIRPASRGGYAVTASDRIAVKVPTGDRGDSIFFADHHGNLSRRDPRQQELPGLRDASATPRSDDNAQEARSS